MVPPLLVSMVALEDAVVRVLFKLEMALYLKTTKLSQRIEFIDFCKKWMKNPFWQR